MKTYKLDPSSIYRHKSQTPFDLSELNPSQKDAVLHNDGPLLVVAGAGSGKTKTLVYKVAKLIHDGIRPEHILLLTFTRKAAQEMLNRAAEIVDQRCHQVAGGTFHSFANELLRHHADKIGYTSQFTILDRSDAEELISMVRRQLGLHQAKERFPKKGTIMSVISKSINTRTPISTVLNEYPQFSHFAEEFEQIALTYNHHKKEMNMMDYDDLLVKSNELLETSPDVKELLNNTYQHILVDEYQDINHLQASMIRQLCGKHHHLMGVGDDAQSIYSFRGADYDNMIEFKYHYPSATIIMLEQNYRSTQPILNLTNQIISKSSQRFAKDLFTERTGNQKPVYIETKSEYEQSVFVCQKILELREEGIDLDEIAVLVRSGWHSNELEIQLKSCGLPFIKVGGFKFIEAAHVKDVLALTKLIENPGDAISWNRLLMMFPSIGAKTADQLFYQLNQIKFDFSKFNLDAISQKKYCADLTKLIQLITQLSQPGTQSVEHVITACLAFYQPYFESKYEDFNKRKVDLDSLETISKRYESLQIFLSEMSLEPPENVHDESEVVLERESNLTISTIHSAKGLEWKAVFLLSAIDGFLPSFQSLSDSKKIDEERRLMYVALTRAKEHLFILKPNFDAGGSQQFRARGGMNFSRPSRFLTEDGLLNTFTEKWSLVTEIDHSSRSRPTYNL